VQQHRLIQPQLDLGCSGLALVDVGRSGEASDGRQGQDRGGNTHLQPPPLHFLDRMRLRLLRQRVGQDSPLGLFFGPRLRLDPGELSRPEPLLALAGQAFAGQLGELGVGPAGVKPAEGVGQIPRAALR
jgi:hypothetical protein